jgi:transposase-like protein
LRESEQRDYTMAFKLEVVGAVEKGEMTYKQAQRKFGIQGRSTVLVWLRPRLVYSVEDDKLIVLVLAVDKREDSAAYRSAVARLIASVNRSRAG